MVQRGILIFLGASSLAIVGLNLVGGDGAAIGFTCLAVGFPVGLMLLGSLRGGRPGAAAGPIVALLALLLVSFTAMLQLRGQGVDGPWVLGLPAAAAIQIYGVFLAALVLVALGYARAFRDFAPREEELEELRRLAARRGEEPD